MVLNMPKNKERSKCSHSREITQERHANMFIFESVKPGKKEVLKISIQKEKKNENTALVLSETASMFYFAMTLMVNRRGQGGFLIQLRL